MFLFYTIVVIPKSRPIPIFGRVRFPLGLPKYSHTLK